MNRRSQAYPCSATQHTAQETKQFNTNQRRRDVLEPSKTLPTLGKGMFQPFWTTASKNPAATEVSNCLLWRLNPANPGIKTRKLDMSDIQTPDLATHG